MYCEGGQLCLDSEVFSNCLLAVMRLIQSNVQKMHGFVLKSGAQQWKITNGVCT